MPEQFFTPLPSSQEQISKFATTFLGECFLHRSTASPIWSKWAWVMSTASSRSNCLADAGQAGFPFTQGSIRITSPPGRSQRTVACPRYVNFGRGCWLIGSPSSVRINVRVQWYSEPRAIVREGEAGHEREKPGSHRGPL